MKKKILLTLAMFATFTMAACGNKAIETPIIHKIKFLK